MWAMGGAAVAAVASAALYSVAATPPEVRPVPTPKGAIAKGNSENYYNGSYIAYAADWSVTSGRIALRRGIDYADTMILQPRTFPAGTEIWWQWPNEKAKTGVYGYNHLAWGYYAGGTPPVPVASSQVADIQGLTTDFDIEVRAERGEFNVLQETFLTLKEKDYGTRDVEVGFLTDPSSTAKRFFASGRQLGEWSDPGGRIWKVAVAGKYCMFMPADGPVTAGRLHYGAAFKWLVAREVLTGKEWFNGLAIGVEPVSGAGSAKIRRWTVAYRLPSRAAAALSDQK